MRKNCIWGIDGIAIPRFVLCRPTSLNLRKYHVKFYSQVPLRAPEGLHIFFVT